ncbi:MAG: biotin/lipoyl-containing protein, partial [Ornithinimicrobium sp.]
MPLYSLPDPGEGLVEAEIVTWKVQEGDQVKTNDIVVEVETAKSLVELPIPYDGVVRKLLVAEGDTVEVGNPIIDIDAADSSSQDPADVDSADVAPHERADDMVPSVTSEQPEAPAPETPKREANLVGYGPSVGATTRRRRRAQGAVTEEPETTEVQPRPKAKPPVRKYAK